jgi:hypothetical protein
MILTKKDLRKEILIWATQFAGNVYADADFGNANTKQGNRSTESGNMERNFGQSKVQNRATVLKSQRRAVVSAALPSSRLLDKNRRALN